MTSVGHQLPLFGAVFGGFLVALVVTPLLTGLTDEAPAPTDLFWAKYLGDGPPEEYTRQGTVLHLPVDRRRLWRLLRFHLVYGVALGLLYGWYLNLGSDTGTAYSVAALPLGLDAFLVLVR